MVALRQRPVELLGGLGERPPKVLRVRPRRALLVEHRHEPWRRREGWDRDVRGANIVRPRGVRIDEPLVGTPVERDPCGDLDFDVVHALCAPLLDQELLEAMAVDGRHVGALEDVLELPRGEIQQEVTPPLDVLARAPVHRIHHREAPAPIAQEHVPRAVRRAVEAAERAVGQRARPEARGRHSHARQRPHSQEEPDARAVEPPGPGRARLARQRTRSYFLQARTGSCGGRQRGSAGAWRRGQQRPKVAVEAGTARVEEGAHDENLHARDVEEA
mmetsp:Transcript_5401/g.19752  ORF Transcript_5401/g.19752 Transcript_5401/m.19752 type:complete len:274 (-) Transcript_5401:920-1741(-)